MLDSNGCLFAYRRVLLLVLDELFTS